LRFALVLLAALALPAAAQPLKPWSGGPAPALELSGTDGKLYRLADYRGSAVLVNFWATWCEPCREEMPSIERLRAAMEGKPFVVLAVNVGEGARTARAFGERMRLGFPLLLDRDTQVARSWSARVLPASFVIGPHGDIRYSYFGAIDWSSDDVRRAIEGLLR
jgi:peroxiredoxin